MRPVYDMKPVYDKYAAMEYWPLEEAIKLVLDVDSEDNHLLIPHMWPELKKQNDQMGGDNANLTHLLKEKRRQLDTVIKRLIGRVYHAKTDNQPPLDDRVNIEELILEAKSEGIDPTKTESQWPVEENDVGWVNAKQFVAWVKSQGIEIPSGLRKAMSAGDRKPRKNDLGRLMEDVLITLRGMLRREPTNDEVYTKLEEYDEGDIIQEITEDHIYWRTHTGTERNPTSRKSFDNRLANMRSDKR